MVKGEVRLVAPDEPAFAGHSPGSEVPEGRALIEATFEIKEEESEPWMEERRSDGTYRWCRAKKRGGRGFCRAPAVVGMNRCRIHGGNTPVGVASPHWKHGRDSRITAIFAKGRYEGSLTEAEREDYSRERLDENITSLSDEIALLRLRLKDLMGLRDVANTAEAWRKAREAFKAMKLAQRFHNELAFAEAFAALESALTEDTDYAYQKEIVFQIEQIRKLADTEQKRLTQMQQLITSNEFISAITAVLTSVRRNVSDPEEQKAVLTDIQRILIGAA